MSKRFAIGVILILLVLNLGVGYFIFYKAKASADTLTSSASEAASSATSQNLLNLNKADLPSSDVEGEDPAGITRYKGSVRSAYNNDNGKVVVEYKVVAAPNVVLSYYKTQLAENNWILEKAASETAEFAKDSQLIDIEAKIDQAGITTFTITLTNITTEEKIF